MTTKIKVCGEELNTGELHTWVTVEKEKIVEEYLRLKIKPKSKWFPRKLWGFILNKLLVIECFPNIIRKERK